MTGPPRGVRGRMLAVRVGVTYAREA